MNPFIFHIPTRVIFGAGVENQAAHQVRLSGGSRVILVYGGKSALKSGLLDRLTKLLLDEGLQVVPFGGAQPNPTLAHAEAGAALARQEQVDFVLAVGGGSAIDTGKAIAHGAKNPAPLWEIWTGKAPVTDALPLGVVLTIPAAGSEMSDSAVLTNTAESIKRGLSSEKNRPAFALLDPKLAMTLPPYQMACGVTDIMMHTMDRYFNPVRGNETTDALAEALLRTVIAQGRSLLNAPSLEAMSEIMWCSSLSHNGLTGLGGKKDFATHQLGHVLSARHGAAHGASLAAVWPAWARFVYQSDPSRFARYARNVWGIQEPEDTGAALAGIAATEAFFRSLGMPVCLQDLGISATEAELETLADLCTYGRSRTIGSFQVLGYEEILKIYRAARQ